MTDLSKGIISFDEIEITNKTTKQNVLQLLADSISPASGENTICLMRFLTIDSARFAVTFNFGEDGNITSLQLTPYIQYKSEKWDRTGRQEERRQFCDKWLLEYLGTPLLNNDGALYDFDSVRISCVTHFDIQQGADAGYIVITYR